jgi:hypothetical protein
MVRLKIRDDMVVAAEFMGREFTLAEPLPVERVVADLDRIARSLDAKIVGLYRVDAVDGEPDA